MLSFPLGSIVLRAAAIALADGIGVRIQIYLAHMEVEEIKLYDVLTNLLLRVGVGRTASRQCSSRLLRSPIDPLSGAAAAAPPFRRYAKRWCSSRCTETSGPHAGNHALTPCGSYAQ
jgi:hypothetical protein